MWPVSVSEYKKRSSDLMDLSMFYLILDSKSAVIAKIQILLK